MVLQVFQIRPRQHLVVAEASCQWLPRSQPRNMGWGLSHETPNFFDTAWLVFFRGPPPPKKKDNATYWLWLSSWFPCQTHNKGVPSKTQTHIVGAVLYNRVSGCALELQLTGVSLKRSLLFELAL